MLATSLIYRTAPGYELVMRLLYGRHYHSRYTTIAEIIKEESSVLDVCCGPGTLFTRCLNQKRVHYTGLDINPAFVAKLRTRGAAAEIWDLRSGKPLPPADYVVMQASLYHFLPDPAPVVDLMLRAARLQLIIAEPVRNLATSSNQLLRIAGRLLTNPGSGEQHNRFTEHTLDAFFQPYGSHVIRSMPIPGSREKIYILQP
jgi:SAM-dependent methyltransferase